MIDLTDVLLYRDYTNYKDGYVKHFISTDYSEDKNHLFVINLSKTIGSYLLNEKNEISVRNDEEFSMKVIEWIGEIRKDLFLTPVFLKQNNTNYVELMKELVYNSVLLSERNKENKLKYYEYQMKSLKTHNKFEAAAQVREKIKNFNN